MRKFADNMCILTQESQLVKLVELLVSEEVSGSIRKVAWSQLAFLLEDPTLHQPFLSLCSLQYLTHSFIGMLKVKLSASLKLWYATSPSNDL